MKQKLLYTFLILTMLLLVVISPISDSGVAGARAQSEKCKTCLEQARALHKKCMSECDAVHGTADTASRLQCRNGCRTQPESNEFSYCSKAGSC